MNEETRKVFAFMMEENTEQIKNLLETILQVAPDEVECTDNANDLFAEMQNLKEAIQSWERHNKKIFED